VRLQNAIEILSPKSRPLATSEDKATIAKQINQLFSSQTTPGTHEIQTAKDAVLCKLVASAFPVRNCFVADSQDPTARSRSLRKRSPTN
jgi:pantothenate kinase-related protein Tda10